MNNSNMMKRLLILMALCFSLQLPAQILPPDFLCVTNDTLVWLPPNNTCGAFNAYLIYAGQQPGGPFSILASVNNAAQTTFYHAGAAGATWYYYLVSDYNCPGQPALSSDTLDNRIPDPGPIRYVSVVNGDDVEIRWDLSPSPEVYAYVISRNTAAGTTIIDTVFGGANVYLDANAAPDEGPETYFVSALDRCGNKSLVTSPHTTLFVETGDIDPCTQSLTLSWNAYQNWAGGVERYEIWVGQNGQAPVAWDTVPGSALTYVFDQADDGVDYCFEIKAVEAGTGVSATSNTVCRQATVIQPLRRLVLLNATVNGSGGADLRWLWAPENAQLTAANLQRANNLPNFTDILPLPTAIPLLADNNAEDNSAPVAARQLFYRIETTDACGATVRSNEVGLVHLSGQALDDNINRLQWTPFYHPLADSIRYELYRQSVGAPAQLTDSGVLTFEDLIDISKPDQTQACYYVEAVARLQLPDGETRTVTSRSNVVCLEQAAKLFVPNAFSPDGVNRIFRPLYQFGAPQSYRMVIYDRWGGQLFESNAIENGWDGAKEGRPLPQGVYLYTIRLVQSGGQVIEKKGSVLLVR